MARARARTREQPFFAVTYVGANITAVESKSNARLFALARAQASPKYPILITQLLRGGITDRAYLEYDATAWKRGCRDV